MNIIETWIPIEGFEDRYEVSNLGNVRSTGLVSIRKNRWGTKTIYHGKPHLMALNKYPNGYLFVSLSSVSGKVWQLSVHRLVAAAFLPNPMAYPIVNHKDGIRSNNRVENLEWCDYSYNNTYGEHRQKMVETMRMNRKDRWRPKFVLQFSQQEELIAVYPSIIEAHRKTGCDGKTIWLSAKKRGQGYRANPNRVKFFWQFLDVDTLPDEYKPYLVL